MPIEKPTTKCRDMDYNSDEGRILLYIIREFSHQMARQFPEMQELGKEALQETIENLIDEGILKILTEDEAFYLAVYHPDVDDYFPI